MGHVLLTVSGKANSQEVAKAQRGERPMPDYAELERALHAELLDYDGARRQVGRLATAIERTGGKNALLAWACFARRHDVEVIFTDGEQVGLPLALLLKVFGRGRRDTRHVMIGHALSSKAKATFFERLRVQSHLDRVLVYSSAQRDLLVRRYGMLRERVVLTPFQVDTHFYSPEAAGTEANDEVARPTSRPLICASGLERRDYPTLLAAVDGLPVDLVITASSAWSKQVSTAEGVRIPENVSVRQLSYPGLRQLYHYASFMVMPLQNADFAAGVTAILEAMATAKPVICSSAPGQTDVVVDGENGVYVPVGDVAALREAIRRLLENPARAGQMGQSGQRLVQERMSLQSYVAGLKGVVDSLLAARE
jgi:glycosyltransferase involved in cell wall biosynthesis